jgi:hypothetical protein
MQLAPPWIASEAMTANVAIYSPSPEQIPLSTLRRLAKGATVSLERSRDAPPGFRIAWKNVVMNLSTMPASDMPTHLLGFQGYVQHLAGQEGDEMVHALLDRIERIRLVHGVVVEPDFDDEGKAQTLVMKLLEHYGGLLFVNGAVHDEEGNYLIGPEGEEEAEENDRNGEEDIDPTPNQLERAERSKALLRQKKLPLYQGKLFVEDDRQVTIRQPSAVARRALVLWGLIQRGQGMPAAKALAFLDAAGVRNEMSPKERKFLKDLEPGKMALARMVWRAEALWVFLWALQHVDDLDWPKRCCNHGQIGEILKPLESDPHFVAKARLRPVADILDAQDLTIRLHWAVRDAWLRKEKIPADLDWSGSAERVFAEDSFGVGVVEQRHLALNWLVCFGDAEWDDVDTPT